MNRDHFWLTEAQFSRLEALLPSGTRGKPRVDDRRVISGIVHVLKSGGRWVDAPEAYGPHKTLYNRFVPPKANRRWKNCFSPHLYRNRNAIERMFGRLKDFRRIATRYDRSATNFLAAVCLAATVSYWL